LGCAGGGSPCADDNAGDRRSRQVLPEPRRRVPRRFRALPAPLYRNSYAGTPSVPLYCTASALLFDCNVVAIPCKNAHLRAFLNFCYPESTYTPRVMLHCSFRVRPAHGSTSTTTCASWFCMSRARYDSIPHQRYSATSSPTADILLFCCMGQTVLKQLEAGNGMYWVVEGQLEVMDLNVSSRVEQCSSRKRGGKGWEKGHGVLGARRAAEDHGSDWKFDSRACVAGGRNAENARHGRLLLTPMFDWAGREDYQYRRRGRLHRCVGRRRRCFVANLRKSVFQNVFEVLASIAVLARFLPVSA
jgi:hypothetical protein